MGHGDLRLEIGYIPLPPGECCILVSLDESCLNCLSILDSSLQVALRRPVRREDAHLGPHLYGHVGDRHPLRDAHPLRGLTPELTGQIVGPVGTYIADDAQDGVL